MQGILNDRMLWYHLVRRFVVLLPRLASPASTPDQSSTGSKWRVIVLGTPGMRRMSSSSTLQGEAGENGQPGCWLCKSSLQETVGYAGRKLPAGVANDWVTRRSPVACLADLKVNIHHVSPSLPSWRPPLAEGGACRTCLHAMAAQCTVWPAGPRE